jgi:hypothetical protein
MQLVSMTVRIASRRVDVPEARIEAKGSAPQPAHAPSGTSSPSGAENPTQQYRADWRR